MADWPHLFRPGAAERPVFLLLHGTGGDEEQISGLAPALDAAAGVLAPRGRVTENGMNRWFRRLSEGVFDVDDVVDRAGELAEFLNWARRHYDLGDRSIVAVGFSNGANIALATALLHPEVLTRAIAFSGMNPLPGRDPGTDLRATAVLMVNGVADPMAPLPSVAEAVALMRGHGAAVEQVRRPGGHGLTQADVVAARSWLAQIGSPALS